MIQVKKNELAKKKKNSSFLQFLNQSIFSNSLCNRQYRSLFLIFNRSISKSCFNFRSFSQLQSQNVDWTTKRSESFMTRTRTTWRFRQSYFINRNLSQLQFQNVDWTTKRNESFMTRTRTTWRFRQNVCQTKISRIFWMLKIMHFVCSISNFWIVNHIDHYIMNDDVEKRVQFAVLRNRINSFITLQFTNQSKKNVFNQQTRKKKTTLIFHLKSNRNLIMLNLSQIMLNLNHFIKTMRCCYSKIKFSSWTNWT